MPSTISRTVAMAIPIPEAEALKSKTTAKIIAKLEQREEALLARIIGALDPSGKDQGRVLDMLRGDGYLGT